MTEEKFVELMNQIPVMSEKLDRVIHALNKIAENQSFEGIVFNDDSYPHIEYSEVKFEEDNNKRKTAEELRKKAAELIKDADDIINELGI